MIYLVIDMFGMNICRATAEDDVRLKVLYCGICHTDLHFLKNEWGMSTYPLVPG